MPTSVSRDIQCLCNGIDTAHETDDPHGLGADLLTSGVQFVELIPDFCDRSLEISIRLAILALGGQGGFAVSLASSDGDVLCTWGWPNVGTRYVDFATEETTMDLLVCCSIKQHDGWNMALFIWHELQGLGDVEAVLCAMRSPDSQATIPLLAVLPPYKL